MHESETLVLKGFAAALLGLVANFPLYFMMFGMVLDGHGTLVLITLLISWSVTAGTLFWIFSRTKFSALSSKLKLFVVFRSFALVCLFLVIAISVTGFVFGRIDH